MIEQYAKKRAHINVNSFQNSSFKQVQAYDKIAFGATNFLLCLINNFTYFNYLCDICKTKFK